MIAIGTPKRTWRNVNIGSLLKGHFSDLVWAFFITFTTKCVKSSFWHAEI